MFDAWAGPFKMQMVWNGVVAHVLLVFINVYNTAGMVVPQGSRPSLFAAATALNFACPEKGRGKSTLLAISINFDKCFFTNVSGTDSH